MRLTRTLVAAGATAALAGTSLFMALPASAASPAPDAVKMCKQLDEAGFLDPFGINQGECVNLLKEPRNENSNNFIAGICGIDLVQEFLGTKNKGQCIKTFRA